MFVLSISDTDDKGVKYEKIGHFVAGMIFAIGWWIFIDCVQALPTDDTFGIPFKYQLPMYFSLLTIFLLNSFPWSYLNSPIDPVAGQKARLIFFIAMFTAFACLIAQIWILSDIYSNENKTNHSWPGVAMILTVLFNIISAIIIRYSTALNPMSSII